MTGSTDAAVHGAGRTLTLDDLDRDVLGLRALVPRGGVAVVTARQAPVVAACLTALDGWASLVDLRGPDVQGDGLPAGAIQLDDDLAAAPAAATAAPAAPTALVPDVPVPELPGAQPSSAEPVRTRWCLYSSGTTGVPTPTDHTLASLAPAVRDARPGGDDRPLRWGLLYAPTRMAGLQVLMHALARREHLVDVTHLSGIDARVGALVEQDVDALSATSTLWRQILQASSSSSLALRQVTLGGEIATQPLLDSLSRAFGTRVTHVYASTEAGTVLSVSDGREGFPVQRLHATRSPALEIRDGVLYVHAPRSTAAGPDGFVRTDDLVEVDGDRVRFLGRASGLANVGGEKVAPERVESVIRSHPLVADVAVTARRNSFSGVVLTADVVVLPGTAKSEVATVERTIRDWVARHLTRAHVPARVAVVPALTTTSTGKAQRT